MLEALYQFFQNLVGYLFDPVKALDVSLKILGMLFDMVAYVLTHLFGGNDAANAVGKALLGFGDWLASDQVTNLYTAALYLISPVVSPTIVQACIVAIWVSWLVTSLVAWLMWLKGQIPTLGGGTT